MKKIITQHTLWALLFGGCFALITYQVMHQTGIYDLNTLIYNTLQSFRFPAALSWVTILTLLAEKRVILFPFATLLLWLLIDRRWITALHWAAIYPVIPLKSYVKHHVQLLRPGWHTASTSAYSFPSGHIVYLTVILSFFAYLIAQSVACKHRCKIYLATLLMILAIMISRVYLEAHWISDVLGGFCLGATYLSLLLLSYRLCLKKLTPQSRPTNSNAPQRFVLCTHPWLYHRFCP